MDYGILGETIGRSLAPFIIISFGIWWGIKIGKFTKQRRKEDAEQNIKEKTEAN